MKANDFIIFGKWILHEFKLYRNEELKYSKLEEVWEQGLIKLKAGDSVSKLLKEADLEELTTALQNFKCMEDCKLIKGKNSPY